MPRRMRMFRDGRNPYGSRGGYVVSDRRRMPEYRSREYSQVNDSHFYDEGRRYDMGYDYPTMNDGHYNLENRTYYPIEAMGKFNGYYGFGESNYRGARDYGPPYYDMGDYGETLTREELENWKRKLLDEVDDKDKPLFNKENIISKARAMGITMNDYNEDELFVATLMAYTDYYRVINSYIGSNIDIYISLAKAWLEDKDVQVKGGEKLAVYYDCIVR